MRMRLHLTISVMVVVLFHCLSTNSLADFTFIKIADTETTYTISGNMVQFERFGFPSISSGNVAFQATDRNGDFGIYIGTVQSPGELDVIADENTLAPNFGRKFSFFKDLVSIDGEQVAFVGQGVGKSQMGIYIGIPDGAPVSIADSENNDIPGGTGKFVDFFGQSLESGDLAFLGTGSSGQAGIYTYINGQLDVIADKNTLGDVVFDYPSIDAGDVAFGILKPLPKGSIYTYINGTLTKLYDTQTTYTISGETVQFDQIRAIWLDKGNVMFIGPSQGFTQEGIYNNVPGTLSKVVDTNTPRPQGGGTFFRLHDPSLDNGNTSFSEKAQGQPTSVQLGIYLDVSDLPLMKVIESGDSLDGKTTLTFDCRREALSGFQIAFLARFTDGSQGIFVASDSSLPVELTSFKGTMTSDGVLLTWKTHSETNNLGFHVYRSQSKDGTYSRITTRLIKGHGSSGGTHDYTFLDETVEAGKNYWYLIEDVDFSGVTERSFPIEVISRRQVVSKVITPIRFALHQNYPNPFNPETWIPYDIAAEAFVTIAIYDATGQQIRKLFLGKKSAGAYLPKDKATYWNGRKDSGELVPGGIYFYTLQIDEAVPRRDATTFRAVRKMIILK